MSLSGRLIAAAICSILPLAQLNHSLTANSQAQDLRSDKKQPAASRAPFPLQLEIRVPFEPTAFPSGQHVYVMYELHLTNYGAPLSLSRIELFDADAAGEPIASFQAEQLETML